jgi:hypothetical protein
VTALAAIRWQTHIRGADPEDRTGSGDLENALLVLRDGSRLSRPRSRLDVLSGHPFWNSNA